MRCLKPDAVSGMSTSTTAPCDGTTPAAFIEVRNTSGAALPLTALGYVAWRAWHPAAAQWPELAPSWDAVGAHLSGAQFRAFLGRFAPSPVQQERAWTSPIWYAPGAKPGA